jgi:large subunit ribosomal protein L18
MRPTTRKEFIARRHKRLRQRVRGTAARPRLAVAFTGKNIYAQLVDDIAGKTLAFASTLDKSFGDKPPKGNREGALAIGKLIGQRAVEKGIKTVVFDRGGFSYRVSKKKELQEGVKGKNRVALLADAVRAAGLKF